MFDDGRPGGDGWGIYTSDEAGQEWHDFFGFLWSVPGDALHDVTTTATDAFHVVASDTSTAIATTGEAASNASSYVWALAALAGVIVAGLAWVL